jgi:5'-3' exonuclease
MGIKGIFPVIHEHVPNAFRSTTLAEWRGKKWGFDSNGLMYKFMYGNRPNSHLLQFASLVLDMKEAGIEPWFIFDGKAPIQKAAVKAEREKRKRDLAEKVKNQEELIKKCEEIVKRPKIEKPDDKEEEQTSSTQIVVPSVENATSLDQIQTPDETLRQEREKLFNMKMQGINVTPEHIAEVKMLLRAMGQKVIEAESEGEAW